MLINKEPTPKRQSIPVAVLAIATFFYCGSSWAADAISSPEPPRADGLWTVSTSFADQPDKGRTVQECVTHDPTWLAQMKAYTDKARAATKIDFKISNENRTPTSWSYDFVSSIVPSGSGATINESGSRQFLFPDDKHRTERETATSTGPFSVKPMNIDSVKTSTWISADCGDVKPLSVDKLRPVPDLP
jgi:hypothetical protein